jgi:uncharacterized protein with FMN-binding domain
MPTPNDPYDGIVNPSVPDERISELAARSAARRRELELNPPRHNGSKRRHAAKGSRTAALGLAFVSTLGMAAYLHQASQSSGSGSLDLATSDSTLLPPNTTVPSGPPTTSRTPGQAPATTPTTKSSGTKSLADGNWTGAASMTRWGPVQVAITVSGSKITAASAPLYPSDDNRSISINRIAIPKLVQSTLTAQNANVNSVSGATYTSASYKISLQSAIDKSRAAS